MKFDLVVFDLDGTLLETLDDLSAAVNHALGCSSLPLHTVQEYRSMVGHGVRNLVCSALPESMRDDASVDHHLALFKDYYSSHIDVLTHPYPGIPELLSELSAAGVKLAVASNKFQEGTEVLIRKFFPEVDFVAIMGNRPGAALKPDPQIVHAAIASAGLNPDGMVAMVGDSGTDVATGRNAGACSVAVTWGFRSRESLELAGPDVMVDGVDQLASFLLDE